MDQTIIKAIKKRDAEAQKKVYQQLAPAMLGVCLRYMRNRENAEDALLQGFLKVFTKIDQFDGKGSFEGWVRKIMVNTCLTELRKNKMLFLSTDAYPEEPFLLSSEDWADSHLEEEVILSFIQKLPPGYGTVFNLYAIEGYSHKEIAQKLNISIGTSKSQLFKARDLLQKYIIESESYNSKNATRYEATSD